MTPKKTKASVIPTLASVAVALALAAGCRPSSNGGAHQTVPEAGAMKVDQTLAAPARPERFDALIGGSQECLSEAPVYPVGQVLGALELYLRPPPLPASNQRWRRDRVVGDIQRALTSGVLGFCGGEEERRFNDAVVAEIKASRASGGRGSIFRVAVQFHWSGSLSDAIERELTGDLDDVAKTNLEIALDLIDDQRRFGHPFVEQDTTIYWQPESAAAFLAGSRRAMVVYYENRANRKVRLGVVTVDRDNRATVALERGGEMADRLARGVRELRREPSLTWRRSQRTSERTIENKLIKVSRTEPNYVFAVASALEDRAFIVELEL